MISDMYFTSKVMQFKIHQIIRCLKSRRKIWLSFCRQYAKEQLVKQQSVLTVCQPPWKVLFFGTDSFSVASLQALHRAREGGDSLVSCLEVVTKDAKGNETPVRTYATKHKFVLYNWPNLEGTTGRFDVGIVVSFGQLISEDVINNFPLGMLNVHASLLPRWRGSAPVVHTILNGDDITGVTIMQIAPHKFDVGKIVLQQSCPVPARATTSQLTSILAELGANLLITCLKELDHYLGKSEPQDSALATKAPKVRAQMAWLSFEKQTCLEIDRLHRAIRDIVKLKTLFRGATLCLDDMVDPKVMSAMDQSKMADQRIFKVSDIKYGTIIYHKRRKILCIRCKDGWVGFHSVVIEERPRMTARDFYNGFLSKIKPEQWYFDSTNKQPTESICK